MRVGVGVVVLIAAAAGFAPSRGVAQPTLLRPPVLRAAAPPPKLLLAPTAAATPPAAAFRPIVVAICGSALGLLPASLKLLTPAPEPRLPLRRRVFTGCAMGAIVSSWIFAGSWAFLALFAGMAVVTQTEYYALARAVGGRPTWKLGVAGSVAMYAAACSPSVALRDALLPAVGTLTIAWLLIRQLVEPGSPPTTKDDVATTFMGIYLLGYMPAFWIRLRRLGPLPAGAVLGELLPAGSALGRSALVAAASRTGADFFTVGALVQWWTMLSIVAADVAAYFTGKQLGRTPLMPATSPSKTWEGLAGGCVAAMAASALGARLMRWPRPLVSGALYGLMCALMALLGDLTVSLLKRSAGAKDTGTLLPGHGGLLDRLDSYLLVPAPAFFFVQWLLPRLGY
jgi:phosphatidate cytidylyltransferase